MRGSTAGVPISSFPSPTAGDISGSFSSTHPVPVFSFSRLLLVMTSIEMEGKLEEGRPDLSREPEVLSFGLPELSPPDATWHRGVCPRTALGQPQNPVPAGGGGLPFK